MSKGKKKKVTAATTSNTQEQQHKLGCIDGDELVALLSYFECAHDISGMYMNTILYYTKGKH